MDVKKFVRSAQERWTNPATRQKRDLLAQKARGRFANLKQRGSRKASTALTVPSMPE